MHDEVSSTGQKTKFHFPFPDSDGEVLRLKSLVS